MAILDDANTIDPSIWKSRHHHGQLQPRRGRYSRAEGQDGAYLGTSSYSRPPPTCGVNMAGNAIVDDEAARDAAKMEIVRRYFQTAVEVKRRA